jgi:hypothetical protein
MEQEEAITKEINQRWLGREIIGMIGAHDPYTRYSVIDGILHVYSKKLLSDHEYLIINNKQAIIEYLTTSPDEEGECIRGHNINWWCSPYGVWVCRCYVEMCE